MLPPCGWLLKRFFARSARFRRFAKDCERLGSPSPASTLLGRFAIIPESAMVASIWLQPVGEEREILRDLIARLAAEYGTMPFEPHLTVCTIANPTSDAAQAAADYITTCRTLPLLVCKTGMLYSPTVPFRAVTIGVENAPDLRGFREMLRELTSANELVEPHIRAVSDQIDT